MSPSTRVDVIIATSNGSHCSTAHRLTSDLVLRFSALGERFSAKEPLYITLASLMRNNHSRLGI